ncbi:alpha/beta hydrolase, partial [Neisseria iguanae]
MLKPEITAITGPAGPLETIYLPAQGTACGVAVVNHPNPLQGGTNTNKVIQTAAKALTGLGFHCYLPNLRGVGNSGGEHDYGKGETDDCICVIDYARAQHPELEKFVLAGFSF